MAGTKAGAAKTKKALLKKNPNHYAEMGAKGGSKKVPKGFAVMDKEKRKKANQKGGRNSRKGKHNG